MLVGAVPLAWSVARQVIAGRRADLLRLLAVPPAAVAGTEVSWGLALRTADGALFHSDHGLVATSLPLNWAAGVAVLAAATVVTAVATWRAAGQLRTAAQ